jgi:hypothetical protein
MAATSLWRLLRESPPSHCLAYPFYLTLLGLQPGASLARLTARQALLLDRISYNGFKTGVLQRPGDERGEGAAAAALVPGKAEAVSAGSVSIGSESVPDGPTNSMSASGSVSRANSSRASGCTRVGHHARICRASAAAVTVSESRLAGHGFARIASIGLVAATSVPAESESGKVETVSVASSSQGLQSMDRQNQPDLIIDSDGPLPGYDGPGSDGLLTDQDHPSQSQIQSCPSLSQLTSEQGVNIL